MNKDTKWFWVFLIVVSLFLTVIGGEIALRVISHTDIDGNVYVAGRRIRPFHFPIKSLKERLTHYRNQGTSYTQYDPDLGWAVRPSSQSDNGLYFSNSHGIRTSSSRQETHQKPLPGTLRIAIFGDSFTHGDDVSYEESWGAILEKTMKAHGRRVEVINLGGQGYAIDQAFLRWRKHGKPLQPHLVLFGFQHSNVKRTMNLIRMLYSPGTGIIFSKPRFRLKNNTLHLLNVPTVQPERLMTIYNDFNNWELKDSEFFYQEANYSDHSIYTSRLASLIITGVTIQFSHRRKGYDFFARDSMSRKIVWRIIEEFKYEVETEGGEFKIVHLPTKRPMTRLLKGQRLKYEDLLEEMKANFVLIDPSSELVAQVKVSSFDTLFSDRSNHYSKVGNQVVGETIANALLSP